MFGVRDSTGTWRDVIPVGYSLTHRPCSHCNCWSMGLGLGLILGLDLHWILIAEIRVYKLSRSIQDRLIISIYSISHFSFYSLLNFLPNHIDIILFVNRVYIP
ncbi:Bgt-50445 [Blumeria graminis f. sp. tritici]|uniref:Bgt-50445 n=2 Tax=Blumeria graminis f. sp. tritici TaxID=62690 RepID=A0A9X9MJ04_BLUGR|nr:Bgt-50445 [Blumeria graminis f. sp. tritici]